MRAISREPEFLYDVTVSDPIHNQNRTGGKQRKNADAHNERRQQSDGGRF
jgi:hypothetical protein